MNGRPSLSNAQHRLLGRIIRGTPKPGPHSRSWFTIARFKPTASTTVAALERKGVISVAVGTMDRVTKQATGDFYDEPFWAPTEKGTETYARHGKPDTWSAPS